MNNPAKDVYELPDWPEKPPQWTEDLLKLLKESSVDSKRNENLENVIKSSDTFPIKFPIDTVRCKTLLSSVKKETLERNIQSTYPLIHEATLFLYAKFLLHKTRHGTSVEKELYKTMTLAGLVQRLLTKRAVIFMGKSDQYLLLDGTKGCSKWETIGKEDEKKPLVLKDCISYDEIKLSALLSVSSYSYFINNGSRKNKGIPDARRTNLEDEGIIIGIIGARLKRKNVMEYQEIVISKMQNTEKNGYGKDQNSLHNTFAEFYEEPCSTYEDVKKIVSKKKERFTALINDEFFDNVMYAKRLAISFDTLLLEANHRAATVNKFAYVHLVGIGLGVWRIADHQEDVFVETFGRRLSKLRKKLQNISDIHFAYFARTSNCGKYKDGDIMPVEGHPKGGIKIHISKREPFTKVAKDNLLVVSYAWDGNASPGNEFWKKSLASTGDSATASSTQVAELHNPHINKNVCAENLMIVTPEGHVPMTEYISKHKKRAHAGEETGSSSKR